MRRTVSQKGTFSAENEPSKGHIQCGERLVKRAHSVRRTDHQKGTFSAENGSSKGHI